DPKFRTDGFRKHESNRLKLEARLDDIGDNGDRLDLAYRIELGFPPPAAAAFPLEAHVKLETLSRLGGSRPVELVRREGPLATGRDGNGKRREIDNQLLPGETLLARGSDLPALEA